MLKIYFINEPVILRVYIAYIIILILRFKLVQMKSPLSVGSGPFDPTYAALE
jgi:hypothetical protein